MAPHPIEGLLQIRPGADILEGATITWAIMDCR
jgi:hypothetical protein